MTFTPLMLALLGLLLAGWTLAALWALAAARTRERKAEAGQRQARRLARMVDESPALPLLVRVDGKIEAPQRLAGWLGLDAVPQFLTELDGGRIDGGGGGLTRENVEQLGEEVRRCQRTATPFRMVVTPRGSTRSLALRGHLADPQISPGGAALVWVFDFSDSESELVQLRDEAAQARGDFAALVGLIEAAPMPMWFRGPEGELRLVNTAYVTAIGGENARQVVADGIELIENVDGLSARQIAVQAAGRQLPIERMVSATIDGARRALRVSDLPLGQEGIAGYAVDVEEMEELARSLKAFGEAERTTLSQLSAGVAQFDRKRQLTFANAPFQRLFKLGPAMMLDPPPFERLLDHAREAGRVPEARDFPAWRRERADWFTAGSAQEESWMLADGTHLRLVAQPLPDGGLTLIAEDRTEQLQLSAARDTLLRTRTATFDSLFESVAVFAPDGRLQLWNRRFAADWGLDDAFLDQHPRIESLLEQIARRLAKPLRVKVVGDAVRGATLERKQTGGRVVLADGRTLEFAGVPLPDGNGLLTVLDISDSEKAAEALKQRAAALEEADAMKTRFLASMSYEFRTPLTSIGGFAELLQAGLGGDLSQPGREYVSAILQSVERLGEQIESVLDLSQSEAGMLPLAREEFELLPLVKGLADDRAARLAEAGLTLDLRGDKSAGRMTGDRRRLGRALGHLIDNAISATPPGGRVLVEVGGHKGKARVVISDNGAGMDPATLARALEGIKMSADGKGVERRQGLGLPLARQLIEAHGGALELHSEPGQGTAAIVELP
ncbi:MAG: PAS-domain containing protein [Novosphingobium sp.]|uniref:sensor histidine kinase n=1 Tax=Novosphingobium sp. TaxID=1874826 RepID=UPI0032BCD447